jgi:hypothetical protein
VILRDLDASSTATNPVVNVALVHLSPLERRHEQLPDLVQTACRD